MDCTGGSRQRARSLPADTVSVRARCLCPCACRLCCFVLLAKPVVKMASGTAAQAAAAAPSGAHHGTTRPQHPPSGQADPLQPSTSQPEQAQAASKPRRRRRQPQARAKATSERDEPIAETDEEDDNRDAGESCQPLQAKHSTVQTRVSRCPPESWVRPALHTRAALGPRSLPRAAQCAGRPHSAAA